MIGPARPGLRLGVEQEGRYAGKRTLVILGHPRWQAVNKALKDHRPEHVFWELPWREVHTFAGWTKVRSFLRRGLTVTLDMPPWVVNSIPPRLSSQVEIMVRVTDRWTRVDALKIDRGGFHVQWQTISRLWCVTDPKNYAADTVILPRQS